MRKNDKYTIDNLLTDFKNIDLKDLGRDMGYILSPFVIGIFSIIILFIIMLVFSSLNIGDYVIYVGIPVVFAMNFYGFFNYFIKSEKYSKKKAILVTTTIFSSVLAFIIIVS